MTIFSFLFVLFLLIPSQGWWDGSYLYAHCVESEPADPGKQLCFVEVCNYGAGNMVVSYTAIEWNSATRPYALPDKFLGYADIPALQAGQCVTKTKVLPDSVIGWVRLIQPADSPYPHWSWIQPCPLPPPIVPTIPPVAPQQEVFLPMLWRHL